jgi:hypothetical protein
MESGTFAWIEGIAGFSRDPETTADQPMERNLQRPLALLCMIGKWLQQGVSRPSRFWHGA